MTRPAAFWSAAVALGAAAGTLFLAYGLARLGALATAAYDFAFFDQLLWSTANGWPQHQTFVPYHFLGQHVEYAYLALVPAYSLGAGPEAMLLLQSTATGASITVLAGAARAFTGSGWTALAVAAGYALSPYLHRAVAFDFHPENMASGLVFGSAWAAARGKHTLAAALATAILLFKEDQALSVLGLAWLLLALSRGTARRQATVLALVAVAWMVVAVLVVQPAFRAGATSDLVERYADILHQPWAAAARLWHGGGAAAVLSALAVSTPFSIAAPWGLLLPAPHLLLAALSAHSQQATLGLHYAASALPMLLLTHLIALRTLPASLRLPSAILVLLLSAGTAASNGPLAPWRWPVPDPARQQALARAATLVPSDAAVRAQGNLAIAFSRRETIYEFPGHWEGPPDRWSTPWVVLDRDGHVTDQARRAGYAQVVADLPRYGFVRVFDEAGIQVYHCPNCHP